MMGRRWRLGLTIGTALGALVLALYGMAIAGGASSETEAGAEKAIGWISADIRTLEESGFTDADEKLRLLEEERQRILDAEKNPGSEPTPEPPEKVSGVGDVVKGEVECEAWPPFTGQLDLSGARCVSVPRTNSRLFAFLTPRAIALVIEVTADGVSPREVSIPRLSDLENAAIEVDGTGAIHVEVQGAENVISTDGW
jgi:hypothetical protein